MRRVNSGFSGFQVLFASLGLSLAASAIAASPPVPHARDAAVKMPVSGKMTVAFKVPYATISALQMPAWRERGGQRQPLDIGMEVKDGDRILTGTDARAYLKLAEGSTVKLGENASLGFYSRSLQPASNFKGAFDVVAGAFRFTTGIVQRALSERDVTIRVGTATLGIRGTDVWGKSDPERDLVLLIEGRVELKHDGQILEMSEPLTTFNVARKTRVQEMASADPERVQQWAQETEVLPGHGAVQPGGKWRVLLAHANSQQEALGVYDDARAAGYAAQVKVRTAGSGGADKEGQWNYDVVVLNLASQQEADTLAQKINRQPGFAAQAEK